MASLPPEPSPDERPTPVRHLVVVATMLMAVLLYLDRFCIGFAVDYIREDLGLTQRHISWFLSAFFWSYALAQVPSGWLSDRYGARIMLVSYILSWSFFTAMIGAVYSLPLLLLMRLGTGLGQAGAYPTSASVVSKWVPFSNRGTASSLIAVGGRMGGAFAPLLTASLMVAFLPADTPLTLKPAGILHGPRLCAKLVPVEDGGATESGPEESAAAASYGGQSDDLTRPDAAARHIRDVLQKRAGRLPSGTFDLMARAAADYRALEAEKLRDGGKELDDRLNDLRLEGAERKKLAEALNVLIAGETFYEEGAFKAVSLVREALDALERLQAGETLSENERRRLNRFLLEATFPHEVGKLYVNAWRPVMYVYGAAGLFVALLYWTVVRNRPEEHPRCNAAEHALIASGRPAGAPSPHGKPGAVPLKRLVQSGSMWFVCVLELGTNVGWLFIYAWLPRYLIDVHNVPILQRGFMASIPPFVGMAGMLLGGRFTDFLAMKLGLLWGRRLPMILTRFTAALGYLLVFAFSLAPSGSLLSSPWAFIAAFSLVTVSTDMGTGSIWAFKQDVGGRYVGSVLGWGNMWGNLGAAVSPLLYDAILGETPALGDWNTMFLVCAGVFALAGLAALGVDATVPIAPPDEEHESQ